MIRPLSFRIRLTFALAIALAVTNSISSLNATVRKKHHASSTGKSATGSAKSGVTRQSRSRGHKAARSYIPRIDPARKAAILEQISARLRQPTAHAIASESSLEGFYSQLASHEREANSSAPFTDTVRVLQFGDSHTAADIFTGEARHIFQQQFGDGGIGFAYAGHPFAGYRIFGSKHAQSTGWKTQGNHFLQLGDGKTGMGGISISTRRPGESITLEAPCSRLDLQYLQQPGGGNLRFADNDGDPVEIQTDAQEIGAGTFHYSCPSGDHQFKITTEQNAPVTLLGWVATQPGVTWESIGINGAEAPLILKWDQKLFAQYLKDNSPALIVLAYGTNEAASPHWDEENYQQTFASIIDTIHQYVPESSILVVGPADRSITVRHSGWHPYTGTERIIDAQQATCRVHGCAYWDQRERMGGLGSMQQFVYAGWAQPDHTHFTGEGYRALADAFMSDLLAGYHAYKNEHGTDAESATQGSPQNGTTNTNP